MTKRNALFLEDDWIDITTRLIVDVAYAEMVMPSLIGVIHKDDPREYSEASLGVSVSGERLGIVGQLEPYALETGKRLASEVDAKILSEANNFKHSVGTSGHDMTPANFLEAIAILEEEVCIRSLPLVAILHPIQVHDLRCEISLTTGASWGLPSPPARDLGAFASLFGVDLFKSVACPVVNNDEDRQGIMIPVGFNNGLAYSIKTEGIARAHKEMDLSVTLKSRCGDVNGGVRIITDKE